MKNLSAALIAACLIAVGLGAGSAGAQEAFSLTLSVPTPVPLGESGTFTASGFAPVPSHLYVYRHYYQRDFAPSKRCGPTAQQEIDYPYRGRVVEASQVDGSFSVESRYDVDPSPYPPLRAGYYTLCSYLVSYDDPTIGSTVEETPDAQAMAAPITYHIILREASLGFRKVDGKLVVKGRVTVPDGSAECIMPKEAFNIEIRSATGRWNRHVIANLNPDGSTFRLSDRYTAGWPKGSYRAAFLDRVPMGSETGNTCGAAFSNVVRYRGLSTL